jgi:uncharacterized protein YndB with AHSA1/START domain
MNTNERDPRDIISERLVDAPREKIFRAVREPERLARWWGPNGFRSTFEQFDFRTGGEWKFMFHGPDGKDYPNHCRFEAIEEPSLIALRHLSVPGFVLTMTLSDEAGKTRLHWRQRFDTAQLREQLAAVCIPSNEQNFDRLEAELARMA